MATVEFLKTTTGLIYSTDSDRESMKRIGKIGDVIVGEFRAPRSGAFHRKCRVLQETIYDNQDQFTDYKSFREWLKLKTGLYDWMIDPRGQKYPRTRSTSYADMDEAGHADWYQRLINFAVQDGCIFEGKSSEEADAFVDQILGGFA